LSVFKDNDTSLESRV